MLSIVILLVVLALIALRRIGRFRFQIWQLMLFGAVLVLVTGQIKPPEALKAINLDVILFLFGMFIVSRAMEDSGYLSHFTLGFLGRARSFGMLLLLVMLGVGLMAALMMNDTLAIAGTPVMLLLARCTNIRPKVLLLALAFAVTIGSVMSPIGNPQNLLVASSGVAAPFITFLRHLALPTIINLLLTWLILWLYFRGKSGSNFTACSATPIADPRLAVLCRLSLTFIVLAIVAKIVLVATDPSLDFPLTYIAAAGALPIVIGSPKRLSIVRRIDWSTLVFFAAMFILMASVWQSGVLQKVIADLHLNIAGVGFILVFSLLASQLVSNVPLVALYLPALAGLGAGTVQLMALAAGSTIAGNLSILGAASNIIIIQKAESCAAEGLTARDFFTIGLPVTAVNLLVYWLFLGLHL